MPNPFYVQPAGDYSSQFKGLQEIIGKVGEKREQESAMQAKAEKMAAMKQEVSDAYESNDINKIDAVRRKYPDLAMKVGEALSQKYPGESGTKLKDAYFRAATDFSQAPQLLDEMRKQFAMDGIDPQEQAKLDEFQTLLDTNPEEAKKKITSEFGLVASEDEWKRYQDITKEKGEGKLPSSTIQEYNIAKEQGYTGTLMDYKKKIAEGMGKTKKQKTGAFLVRKPDGTVEIAVGSFDPETGKIKTETASLDGLDIISKLGETAVEETERKVGQKRKEATVVGEEKRASELIDRGLLAAESTATIRRAVDLLDGIETGGIEAVKFAAKRFFGVEGANEGELSNSLGKAVLSQLRETFGAQFTESEGKRLERIEASFSKNTKTNKRLLTQVLRIAEKTARRAKKAAEKRGDLDTSEDISDLLEFSLSEPDEWMEQKKADEMTDDEIKEYLKTQGAK